MKGRIHSIESLAAVDGPGLRCAVFLQGCPQRCMYCHNPDTWALDGGESMEADVLAQKILRYRPYFKRNGGVTVSGGEPFLQAAFVKELLQKLKREGIHTAVDTSGYFWNPAVREALAYTDLVLLDIKHTNPEMYRRITGTDQKRLLEFLNAMKENGQPLWIRQVIVPGYTDSEAQMEDLVQLLEGAKVLRVDLLPYHTLGVGKWEALGKPYPLDGVKPPDAETMERLSRIVKKYNTGE